MLNVCNILCHSRFKQEVVLSKLQGRHIGYCTCYKDLFNCKNRGLNRERQTYPFILPRGLYKHSWLSNIISEGQFTQGQLKSSTLKSVG